MNYIWFQINDVLEEDFQDFDSNQSPNLDRNTLLPLTSDDMCYYLKPPATAWLNVKVSTWCQILTKKILDFIPIQDICTFVQILFLWQQFFTTFWPLPLL